MIRILQSFVTESNEVLHTCIWDIGQLTLRIVVSSNDQDTSYMGLVEEMCETGYPSAEPR